MAGSLHLERAAHTAAEDHVVLVALVHVAAPQRALAREVRVHGGAAVYEQLEHVAACVMVRGHLHAPAPN